jgi:hypothetical protein
VVMERRGEVMGFGMFLVEERSGGVTSLGVGSVRGMSCFYIQRGS